jgi:short subunit dehydrogenase-like uncharacterized protein
VSRGTLKTMLEGMPYGGAIRENGKIRRVPQMFDVREIPFASGPRIAMTIPWGDVSTAFRSTKIPNIRVYSSQSRSALKRLKRIKPFLPLLKIKPIQKFVQNWASKTSGPSAETRATARVELWGRVRNAKNDEVSLTMSVAEGYHFTMLSALAAVQRVLESDLKGALTPSMAFGSEFVHFIEGTQA